MAKLTLSDLSAFVNSGITLANANWAAIEAAIENTLSRDGTSPNAMVANFDMNSNRVINLGTPVEDNDAVRLADLSDSDATGAASALLRSELLASTGSSIVGTIQAGGGAVAGTVQAAIRRRGVYPEEYGAVGDGVTDDTAAFNSAISASNVIVLTPGNTYKIADVSADGKILTIYGYGATIDGSAATNGAFYKTDHGNKLTLVGITFIGTKPGLKYVASTTASVFYDFDILYCKFRPTSGFGLHFDGAREGNIIGCYFEPTSSFGGSGIYRIRTVNTEVIGCQWHLCDYCIHDDGQGVAFSAGLKVLGGTMIGVNRGLDSSRTDYVSMIGTMIDFAHHPVRLIGVDRAVIANCFLTCDEDGNRVVYIDQYDALEKPQQHRVHGNVIQHNVRSTGNICMYVANMNSGVIENNNITFWWKYGLEFASCGNLKVMNNKINKDASSTDVGRLSVNESSGGTTTNRVWFNEVSDPISVTARVRYNGGYITENQGELVVPSGNTTFDVAHGLAYTPAKNQVQLTPTNAEAAGKNPYVSAVDATNITVGFTSATAANAGVSWKVSIDQ